jgi:hypothetical protein
VGAVERMEIRSSPGRKSERKEELRKKEEDKEIHKRGK